MGGKVGGDDGSKVSGWRTSGCIRDGGDMCGEVGGSVKQDHDLRELVRAAGLTALSISTAISGSSSMLGLIFPSNILHCPSPYFP